MRALDNRRWIPFTIRPKGADIDKPSGAIKKILRRKMRRLLKVRQSSN